MSDLINSSLRELSAALAAKKVSAVELATLFLDRIDRLNPALNAFIALDREQTLAQARAADASGKVGAGGTPLAGIPLAHKDIFCTKGWRTSCGSRCWRTSSRPTTPTWSKSWPPPAWSRWASSTWTNSPWARPTKPRISAR
jgi:Asp-tRNA(Asn)/Glu-tRNA(Gln) amidotransferase A subunit family amidase